MSTLRRFSSWLFAIGLLAVAMHAFADMGVMVKRGGSGDGGFVAELCTSQGVVKSQAPLSEPDEQAAHACCPLCIGSGPLLSSVIAPDFPPMPADTARPVPAAPTFPPLAIWPAPPSRGPPAIV